MLKNKTSQKKYKNLYFDIDRTLWDLKSNSELTLWELINKHMPGLAPKFKEFLNIFYIENEKLWLQYRNGEISKEILRAKRFNDTFNILGINAPSTATIIGDDFIKESPLKTGLFPYTIETLEYLQLQGYNMYLLTNGFAEVQRVKIKESRLETFFKKMITSEDTGYQKPNKKIFEYALKTVNAKKRESIMIGDDIDNDIIGAKQFGMDTVFFNPEKLKHNSNPTFEIHSLNELMDIL